MTLVWPSVPTAVLAEVGDAHVHTADLSRSARCGCSGWSEQPAAPGLPGARIARVLPELHIHNVHAVAVHVDVRVHQNVHHVSRMQRQLQLNLQHHRKMMWRNCEK